MDTATPYIIELRVSLTEQEIDSMWNLQDPFQSAATDKKIIKRVASLIDQDKRKVYLRKVKPSNIEEEDGKILDERIIRLPINKKKASLVRSWKMRSILTKPTYSLKKHQNVYNGLWLNAKDEKQFHFTIGGTWHTDGHRSTLSVRDDFIVNNEKQSMIEAFKASLHAKYPKLLDHCVEFYQNPFFENVADFSQLCLLSRPYDDDLIHETDRFSYETLAAFARECLEHDLRVVIEWGVYRETRCRFILIVESNVDLEQAYRYALTLP